MIMSLREAIELAIEVLRGESKAGELAKRGAIRRFERYLEVLTHNSHRQKHDPTG